MCRFLLQLWLLPWLFVLRFMNVLRVEVEIEIVMEEVATVAVVMIGVGVVGIA